MDLRIFTQPQQGATYDDLLRIGRRRRRLFRWTTTKLVAAEVMSQL